MTKLTTSFRRSVRPDEIRIGLIERQQAVLIGGQAEEVALLLHPLDRRALRPIADVVGAHGGLGLVVVGFVADGIPAGVSVLVDVALGLHPPPDLLRGAVVARLGGADEVVVRAAERRVHLLEQRRVAVGERARFEALARRRLLHLDAVLVGAGQEAHVVTVEPRETRDRVRGQRLIGVADVRRAVRIGNSGGDIEFRRWHGFSPLADGFARQTSR